MQNRAGPGVNGFVSLRARCLISKFMDLFDTMLQVQVPTVHFTFYNNSHVTFSSMQKVADSSVLDRVRTSLSGCKKGRSCFRDSRIGQILWTDTPEGSNGPDEQGKKEKILTSVM